MNFGPGNGQFGSYLHGRVIFANQNQENPWGNDGQPGAGSPTRSPQQRYVNEQGNYSTDPRIFSPAREHDTGDHISSFKISTGPNHVVFTREDRGPEGTLGVQGPTTRCVDTPRFLFL